MENTKRNVYLFWSVTCSPVAVTNTGHDNGVAISPKLTAIATTTTAAAAAKTFAQFSFSAAAVVIKVYRLRALKL